MLTYSLAPNAGRRARFYQPISRELSDPPPRQAASLLRIDSRFESRGRPGNGRTRLPDVGDADSPALEIVPAHVASRWATACNGIGVEIIKAVTHDRVEFRFRAPWHLLLVYEEGVRDEGETVLGDLPRSSLRTLRRKLTFVPAGHEYREWQQPRVRSRVICFYFDPARMPIHSDASPTAAPLAPRLLFENHLLWETAVKLVTALEDGYADERYCEALGVVVAHELLRVHGPARRREPPARGGLAVWQQRIVTAYIEEHLAESISLAALANLVRLSPYYFCRAFKQSFGVPPHRYHVNRRIEQAKSLLVNPSQSVTDIALALGFSETSSFSAAFRRATRVAPTEYRRTLA
jgi:AraC family transcriptional regulator